jgi:pimeloyl-ACP methyl ester carboxylesterase
VGHSFGGLEAVAFASRYADEVEGVLLLDTTPPAWPQAVCGVADDGSEAAAGFRQTCEQVSGADNVERLDVPAAFAEVAGITSLGDLPLRVVTRAHLTYPGLSAGSEAVLDRAWGAGQQHWASLSPAGHLVPVEDTGHHIQLDQPAVVIGQVLALVHDAGSVTTPEHP